MAATASDLPPYDPERLLSAPFPERVRLVCRTWASQVAPNPFIVTAMYWIKYYVLYIGVWAYFVSFASDYPGFTAMGGWFFTEDAFQKFVLWSIAYELIGLGCSSGPMNARFIPPIGGILYFLRPGTMKLSLVPEMPRLGGATRGWLDVAVNALILLTLLRALVAPEVTPALLLPPTLLLAVVALMDKTVFLAARGEHYWVALVCLTFASDAAGTSDPLWIAGCKAIWLAIWFWAATSKLGPLFPSVIQVMMNNGPFFPKWLKLGLFERYPEDLRPSRLATWMAHVGTATEFLIPLGLLFFNDHLVITVVLLVIMTGFHGFITANNPSGMPLEWNILMVYGGIYLFGLHPEASLADLAALPLLATFLFFCLFVVPLLGNFFPSRVSFLLSMRYYAGNWAYNIWLIKKGSEAKLERLTRIAGTMRQQLEKMLDDPSEVEMALNLSMSHRYMHMEGRPLLETIPKAVDDIHDYEWHEGEVLGGTIIGWNFGDGHLNELQLLEQVQSRCAFEPGEVRVVMVESLPLFGRSMKWKIVDAADGVLEEGETDVRAMAHLQPYPTGEYAEALLRSGASATA